MSLLLVENKLEAADAADDDAANAAAANTDDFSAEPSAPFSHAYEAVPVVKGEPLAFAVLGDNLAGVSVSLTCAGVEILAPTAVGANNRLMATIAARDASADCQVVASFTASTSADRRVRNLWFGPALKMPRGPSAPYTPPNLDLDATPRRAARRSEAGYYIGERTTLAPTTLKLQYPNLTADWVESEWPAAHRRLLDGTIWIAPDAGDLSKCAYAWASARGGGDNPMPAKLTAPNNYSIELDLTLHP